MMAAEHNAIFDANLTALWNSNTLSTAGIGEALHVSKSVVIGRAHRLHLPSKASPLHAAGTPQPPRLPRAGAVTLQAVVPDEGAPRKRSHHAPGERKSAGKPGLHRAKAVTLPPVMPTAPPLWFPSPEPMSGPAAHYALPGPHQCRFGMWQNGAKPTQEFCCKPCKPGSSWCPSCRAVVFQQVTARVAQVAML